MEMAINPKPTAADKQQQRLEEIKKFEEELSRMMDASVPKSTDVAPIVEEEEEEEGWKSDEEKEQEEKKEEKKETEENVAAS